MYDQQPARRRARLEGLAMAMGLLASMGKAPNVTPRAPKKVHPKSRRLLGNWSERVAHDGYGEQGRRRAQIAKGQLTVSNGLVVRRD